MRCLVVGTYKMGHISADTRGGFRDKAGNIALQTFPSFFLSLFSIIMVKLLLPPLPQTQFAPM